MMMNLIIVMRHDDDDDDDDDDDYYDDNDDRTHVRKRKGWPESAPISCFLLEIFNKSPWLGKRPSGGIFV